MVAVMVSFGAYRVLSTEAVTSGGVSCTSNVTIVLGV